MLLLAGCARDTGPLVTVADTRGVAIWSEDGDGRRSNAPHLVCAADASGPCDAEVARFSQLLGGDIVVRVVRGADGTVTLPRTWDPCLSCDDVVVMSRDGVIAPVRSSIEGPFVQVLRDASTSRVTVRLNIRVGYHIWFSVVLFTDDSNVRVGG